MDPPIERPGGPGPGPGGVLGIDEAGRGSLVGPLVVGAFLCDRNQLGGLRSLGVQDSKRLRPARRDEVYQRIRSVGRMFSVSIRPAVIDRYVARGGLNRLEAEAFATLIRAAEPDEVFVDACDPIAERFGVLVRRLCRRSIAVRASHRADVTIPVVGAASIVAKVRRDRAIASLARTHGPGIGSGYPSDHRTIEFVRTSLAAGGSSPGWLRASWSTTGRLKRENRLRPLERYAP